ncbi:acetyltransferase (GNAT) family protein [Paucimonas lemoignei]|uniref:Acetyltransferase (GNAT) family protein n=1 Tax=Paucimonas lemoignei TaxID=29443 RepID=A0A4R3HUZ8_PAULE|nr:GNAT family N-acetyltransferase [Paucimonas lemoignei]TCS36323.1 acetyltransferase (GNAT) family protein [Paucimonas lemoignei]
METTAAQPTGTLNSSGTDVNFYFNEIPEFAGPEIERLYNTLHSSLPFFRIFRTTSDVSTYVARREGRPAVILLFQIHGRTVDVLNEMIDLEKEEVERFASHVFAELPQVHIISFKAIRTTMDRFAYPVQQHNAKDTYVIALPDTPEAYLDRLAKSLRKDILKDLRKIARAYPSFSSRFYEKDEIPEQVLRDLIRMSEDRISKQVSDFSHDEQRIVALARQCGFVNVLTIDGKICAGTVNYFIGDSNFEELIARDPTYRNFGIGILTMYLTICEAIRRGKKKFYLGGGRFDYKEKLLGVLTDADHVEIYRSRATMFLHLGNAAKTLLQAYLRLAKLWVHTHKEHALSKLVTGIFNLYKHQKVR